MRISDGLTFGDGSIQSTAFVQAVLAQSAVDVAMSVLTDIQVSSGTHTVTLPGAVVAPHVDFTQHGVWNGAASVTFSITTTVANELVVVLGSYYNGQSSSIAFQGFTVDGGSAATELITTGGVGTNGAYGIIVASPGVHSVVATLAGADNGYAAFYCYGLIGYDLNASRYSGSVTYKNGDATSFLSSTFTAKKLLLGCFGGGAGSAQSDVVTDSQGSTFVVDSVGPVGNVANNVSFHAATTQAASDAVTVTNNQNSYSGTSVLLQLDPAPSNTPLPVVGKIYTVKNLTGATTVLPSTGLLDGQASFVMNAPYSSLSVFTDGTNWYSV